jgi:hypothetical protein
MGEYKRGFMLMTRLSKIPANAPIHKRQYKRPCLVMGLLRHLSQLGRIIPGVETQIRITPCHATGVCTERVLVKIGDTWYSVDIWKVSQDARPCVLFGVEMKVC